MIVSLLKQEFFRLVQQQRLPFRVAGGLVAVLRWSSSPTMRWPPSETASNSATRTYVALQSLTLKASTPLD